MASENETVADVAKDFERESKVHRMCKSMHMSMFQATKYALRFHVAHKREIDAKDSEESDRLSRIFNIVMDSNEENWRDCMSRIEAITREVI